MRGQSRPKLRHGRETEFQGGRRVRKFCPKWELSLKANSKLHLSGVGVLVRKEDQEG